MVSSRPLPVPLTGAIGSSHSHEPGAESSSSLSARGRVLRDASKLRLAQKNLRRCVGPSPSLYRMDFWRRSKDHWRASRLLKKLLISFRLVPMRQWKAAVFAGWLIPAKALFLLLIAPVARRSHISFMPFRLAWPPLPTMMWSCTAMPSGRATSTIACVIWMSAREGVGSPEG